jgi:hypothetical protein
VLSRISEPKRSEIIGDWRKLHNEELHSSYSAPNILRTLKSRMTKLAGHVARMGISEMYIDKVWLKHQKKRDH